MKFLIALIFPFALAGANPQLQTQAWTANWIRVAGISPYVYGVYHFRRVFTLHENPAHFLIHVSADNRYQLFVNGKRVSWGPARGDLMEWRYESVDIAPQLRAGSNTLAAVVWNFAENAPLAQLTHQSGLLIQGDTAVERVVDTGKAWRCIADPAYSPISVHAGVEVSGYYAAGPGERLNGALYLWGWQQPGFDDSRWSAPELSDRAGPKGIPFSPTYWSLVPRPIPMMEERPEQAMTLRRSDGFETPEPGKQLTPLTIPANQHVHLLFDQQHLTTGYPELMVSGGTGAQIKVTFAESLYRSGTWIKGNRDEIEGKAIRGYFDIFLPDGGPHRTWSPLWWRTWRYIELEIQTTGEPMTLDRWSATFSGYPYQRKASIQIAGDPARNANLQRILSAGWRTVRLCSHETFVDCPYYEQLQYVADTRLQGLVAMTMTGDGRLVRNALALIDATRTHEGITYSRGPTRLVQFIPPFSCWWIGMLHDYWMYQEDPVFVKQMLPGARAILDFFRARQQANGSLGALPWWNNVDWVQAWPHGVPPNANTGSSSVIDLHLLLALQWTAEMERALGDPSFAAKDERDAIELAETIPALYFDPSRGLFADTPAKKTFSQHANALAVLSGMAKGPLLTRIATALRTDESLTKANLYFQHYVHEAIWKAGQGDAYLSLLGPWQRMLEIGLTTFAETEDTASTSSRSDCHGWSAHPVFEMFRTVLGITPSAPGFRRIHVEPYLGEIRAISGVMAHPRGEIRVEFLRREQTLIGHIELPPGTEGDLQWGAQHVDLKAGENRVQLVK